MIARQRILCPIIHLHLYIMYHIISYHIMGVGLGLGESHGG